MSQCVPNWELDDPPSNANPSQPLHLNPPPAGTAAARSDYEVAELTWVNGLPSMHGLGHFRIGKPVPKYPSQATWEKVLTGGGTLESVVDQATGAVLLSAAAGTPTGSDYDLVPWITNAAGNNHRRSGGGGCSTATTTSACGAAAVMDALVPCSKRAAMLVDDHSTRVPEPSAGVGAEHGVGGRKRSRAAGDGNCSVSGSAASMSMGIQFDTCDMTGGDDVGFATSTSPLDGSPETGNTSCGRPLTVVDEHDSASHSHRSLQRDGGGEEEERKKGVGRSSISTKRSRAAAVHNQSERKRRDRINQRMKTLQKLVPNSSKTDKASMLDEVIDYLKQMQAQVQMMSRMNSIPHMMMPMPMQQLQMAMMAQMAQMAQMGMGMGMAPMPMMDMNSLARQQPQPGMAPPPQPVMPHPPAFFPFAGPSWDGGGGDRAPAPAPDPFSAFMACQAQQNPMNMDAFNRFAAMYQQMYHQQPQQPNSNPASNSPNPIPK